jgi:hypothetical protein
MFFFHKGLEAFSKWVVPSFTPSASHQGKGRRTKEEFALFSLCGSSESLLSLGFLIVCRRE